MIENFVRHITDKNEPYIIFDVGSRDCEQSIEFYKHFPNARIFAFECNPNTLPICKKNIEPYADRITLVEGAVTDYDGDISFFPIDQNKTVTTWKDGNPGASSIFQSNGTYECEKYVQYEIQTNCHRLDSIIHKYNLPSVDLIWIDLQGAELLALKGLGFFINKLQFLHIEVSHRPIYNEQVMFNDIHKFMSEYNFSLINRLTMRGWQEDAIYKNNVNVKNVKKPVFIHTIGIEGSGHHFYMDFIDKLIMHQTDYKKGLHYSPKSMTPSDTLRMMFQNIYFNWNMYTNEKIQNVDKDRMYNECIEYIQKNCTDYLLFHGDSYPTLHFRTIEQSIDFVEIYQKLRHVVDFKYIFMHRTFNNAVNARWKLDGGVDNHSVSSYKFTNWIQKQKLSIHPNDYIDLYYENIDLTKLTTFLPFFRNVKEIYQNTFKMSKKVVSSSIQTSIKLSLDKFNAFDVIVPIGPNDIAVATSQIEYIKKNVLDYRNIYIICSDPTFSLDGCITIQENIFPFNKETVSDFHGNIPRNGWYLQQLLKLYAGSVIDGILDKYLVVDSDTFFLKPTTFIENSKCLYNYSNENHVPYYIHMNKLFTGLEKQIQDKSGICHHMLFETKYVTEMMNKIEKEHNDKFFNVFLKNVDPDQYNGSGASEYEIYFNYMLMNHSTDIVIRQLKWKNAKNLDADGNDYDYVSCHWYLR